MTEADALSDSAAGSSDAVRDAVAVNLRRARLAHGRSLRELAEITGVSKALLSQMERRLANPTIEVLTRVGTALDLSFAELTRAPMLVPEVIRADQGPAMTVDDVTVRTLFASSERRRFEVAEGHIPTGTTSAKSSHGQGSVEYAYVVEGSVTIRSLEWSRQLGAGDIIRFSAEYEHTYETGREPVRLLTVVSFSDA